jgi:uncharacterized protein
MQRTVTQSFLLPVLVWVAAMPAPAVSVDAVPDPRPAGWVVDTVGALRPEDRQALDLLGAEVKAQTGAELAVVVVGSTAGVPHRQFATELANRWGLGDREKDNGVLVFAALDDRAAEITLGDGIDDAGQVTIAQDIMQTEMVPRFRDGEPAAAIVAGAVACARRILGVTPLLVVTRRLASAPPSSGADSHASQGSSPPPAPLAAFPPSPPQADRGFAPAASSGAVGMGALALLAGGGIGLLAWGRHHYRRRPRRCPACLVEMVRLDEGEDDAHLGSGERAEERVGSVDYDVWLCLRCNGVETLRYGAFFSSFATCSQCGARTVSSSERTEAHATEWSEGRVRIEESCQHCDHRRSYTRSIPRVVRQQASSSSSWAGSSSSRSSSYSSPSSSSRSSGGGGRSSGSGASGRW